MSTLPETAPAFVEMAHRIVWASVATVDRAGRPRSRVLHPVWAWDGEQLTGWIATDPNGLKRAHLDRVPYLSCAYWAPSHDTCVAECDAVFDESDDGRAALWERLRTAPEPVGYDPRIVPGWESASSPTFGALVLRPWRVRVFPGTVLLTGGTVGHVLTWQADGR
jgi:hypothetical protein